MLADESPFDFLHELGLDDAEQQAAYRWLVRNHHQPVTPRNLHHAMGQLEQELIPWFSRCLHQLQSVLEQASYTPTINQRKRRYG